MYPFINIHTHKISDNEKAIVNLNYNNKVLSNISYSFGLHPYEVSKINEHNIINKLNEYCLANKIVAVGEIGLDRSISTSLELQKKFFAIQLKVAEQYSKPVIIHGVRANSDLLQIRKQKGNSTCWILHGFRGSLQDAKQFINKNCYISFGSQLLTDKKLQNLIKQINTDKIFFETDNSELSILSVYDKAANILDINITELKEQIYHNFKHIFTDNE